MTEEDEEAEARVAALADELLLRITKASYNDSSHVAMAALAIAVFDRMLFCAGPEGIRDYVYKFYVSLMMSMHLKGIEVDGMEDLVRELVP